MFFWAVSVFLSGGTSTYTKSDFRINENQSGKGFKSSATRHISSFFSNFLNHIWRIFMNITRSTTIVRIPTAGLIFHWRPAGTMYSSKQKYIYTNRIFCFVFWDGLFFFLSFFKYDKLNYSNARIVSFFKDLSYTHIL